MPTARTALTSSVVNGKIYVLGGDNSNGIFDIVDIFDPETNSWSAGPPMPTACLGLSSCVVNGEIYTIGGINGGYLNTVEIFDPATNSWNFGLPMPSTRLDITSSVVSGKIYAIGGSTGKVVVGTVEIFDPTPTSVAESSGIGSSTILIGNYPDPTSSAMTLQYSLANESSVSITIYDALGRIVARPVVGEMESAGEHEASFATEDLPPGRYSCRLSAGWSEMFAKMVVVR